jgi:outer membrane protein assembly factor BamB
MVQAFGAFRLPALIPALLLVSSIALAADWPYYWGPERNGTSKETGWKDQFPDGGPKQLWKLNVGVGASTVTVRGDKVFTMGNVMDEDRVLCLDAATGKEVWKCAYPCPLDKRSFEGGTVCTPTLDGDRVFTVSHQGQILSIDAAKGTKVWEKKIIEDLGGKRPQWGFAGSPLVEGNLLIIDAGGKGASTVALAKATGEVKWKAGDDQAGYSSPVAAKIDGRRTIVIFKGRVLVGLDPKNGNEFWRYPWKTEYDVNAAMPLIIGNRIFISSGYNHGCALLEVRGGIKKIWENRNMRNHANSCALLDGCVYGFDGQMGSGKLTCLKLDDGTAAWKESGMGTGAVTIAGGKLIALGESGQLAIAPATPKGFQPTYKGQGMEGHCWVAPVLCGGRLFLRNNLGDLACYSMK